MKIPYLTWLLFIITISIKAQTINQITVLPANPTATDTIRVISDFTYPGDCSFGMVYYNYFIVGPSILILPTYCGYGQTTVCNSIDTFLIEPLPAGSYPVTIEYHQGSICPISGFDATIGQFDSLIIIGTTGIGELDEPNQFSIYPNPVADKLTVIQHGRTSMQQVTLSDLTGHILLRQALISRKSDIHIPQSVTPGMYILEISDKDLRFREKLIVH